MNRDGVVRVLLPSDDLRVYKTTREYFYFVDIRLNYKYFAIIASDWSTLNLPPLTSRVTDTIF